MFSALLVQFLLVISAYSQIPDGPPKGYHMLEGIPAAERIKAREDAIHLEDTNRIYKGNNVDNEQYPYFAGLVILFPNLKGFSFCGSSLVSSNRLVTAAHCWYDGHSTPNQMTVVLGSQFLTTGGLRIETDKVIPHPDYDTRTQFNDIAMIYLPYKINFTNKIFPIALPLGFELSMPLSGQYAAAVGVGLTGSTWEYKREDGPSLKGVVLKIISTAECNKDFESLTSGQLCTSGEGGVGTCHGDSGGPLITYTNRKFLVGVILGGLQDKECGSGTPDVFTRVSSYMDFIESHANLPNFTFTFDQQGPNLVEVITIDSNAGVKIASFNHTLISI